MNKKENATADAVAFFACLGSCTDTAQKQDLGEYRRGMILFQFSLVKYVENGDNQDKNGIIQRHLFCAKYRNCKKRKIPVENLRQILYFIRANVAEIVA